MAEALKHVGRVKNNQRKIVVAYRTIPGDAENCIVVTTENLQADEHDTLMKLIESNAGQTAYEFAEAMARTSLPDGRNMLAAFHVTGKMVKMATNLVEMTPDIKTTILLSELNQAIAQQKGVSIDELALKGSGAPAESVSTSENNPVEITEVATIQTLAAPSDGVLTDEQIATKYRGDADRLYKEAKRLREEADKLSPVKKKSAKTEESA
jgi:hypothetical protein